MWHQSIKNKNLLFLIYVNAVHYQYQLKNINYKNDTYTKHNIYYSVMDKPT